MNEQDKQISSLAIKSLSEKISKEATQSATLEALYTVTAMELEQMKQIIDSDEELKAKFEETKGKMTMAINNYELATKPYLRGSGDNIRTVVEIRLSDGTRYSTNMRELAGDRTNEQEDVLIQAVLDIIKAELDPGSAIVKAQAEIEQAVQSLAKAKTDLSVNKENIDSVSAITEVLIALAIGQMVACQRTLTVRLRNSSNLLSRTVAM